MLIELVVTAGPHAGRTFRFSDHSTFLVGRSSRAHFALPAKDPYVSRLHFIVEVNPPLCHLRDMHSRNGTLVNNQLVETIDLSPGDVIRIGETELTVVAPSSPASDEDVNTLALSAGKPTKASGSGPPPAAWDAATVPPVPTVPGYRLEDELGRGGMGVVYRAVHLASGEVVAIKTVLPAVPPTPKAVAGFLREADVVRRLQHPNIVRFRDSGTTDGRVWFVMEYVPGADAAQLAAGQPLSVPRAVRWGLQLLDALTHAHDRGFIHRDVKPANLLITGPADAEVAKLSDFGLAKAYEASPLSGLTLTGSTGGTPHFMPPEQVLDLRSVKPPADQYAAAATLYRLLTAANLYPPAAGVVDLFAMILESEPIPITNRRPDLPPSLGAAIHRALARNPTDRFADCRTFAAALRPFARP